VIEIIIQDADLRFSLIRWPLAINNALRLATEDTTLYWQRLMKTYPPAPPPRMGTAFNPVRFTTRAGRSVEFMARRSEGYTRTGTLGRSWTSPDSRRVEVGSDFAWGRTSSSGDIAPYNRYVQDAELQARVHQGRWETIQAVMQRTTATVQRFYSSRLAAAVR
jgi:hypothetical protein